MTVPLSIAMTPAFYDADDRLLRMQLQCLQRQTCQDFDTWLIDPHYRKRRDLVPELARRFALRIVHVPYVPNVRIAKILDCAIFNAAFCYSESPRIARYSCYRIVRENWVETILAAPRESNVDFYYHALSAEVTARVWDGHGEMPDWQLLPAQASSPDTGPMPVPANCYGNVCWRRDQWLALNGTDEVFTNVVHYEDLQFDARALLAGQTVVRRGNLLYRLDHAYGPFSHRANHPPDVPFRAPCPRCRALCQEQGWEKDRSDDFTWVPEKEVKVCNHCLLSGPSSSPEAYLAFIRGRGITQATVVPRFRIGRNLRRLAEDMDGLSLSAKVEVFNRSWDDERYY